MGEMATFSAITIIVFASVSILLNGSIKQVTGFTDLFANSRKVHELERRSVLFYQILERYSMETQIPVFEVESLLGEVIALIYKIKISVFH
jgi:hypothetical protein